QMNYFKNASMGFNKEAIVVIPIPNDSVSVTKLNYVRDQLQQYPDISLVSFSYATPADRGSWNSDFKFDHAAKSTDFSANIKWADADYFRTYGLQFVAGRAYFPSDTVREYVVSED